MDFIGNTRSPKITAVGEIKQGGRFTHWHEAVPCGGGTDYFRDKDGNWRCGFFGNDNQASFREKPTIVKVESDAHGLIHVAKDQPDFVLNKKT